MSERSPIDVLRENRPDGLVEPDRLEEYDAAVAQVESWRVSRVTDPAAVDADARAYETWWSLNHMSYTGGHPHLRKQDIEEIASLIRDLAARAREDEEYAGYGEILETLTTERDEWHNRADRLARRVAELETALIWLGWDIGEDALCWCPDHWFDTDETGERRSEHSAPCQTARAALAGDGGGA